MIKVDKNVPPPRQRGKYPWRQMEVGDSFLVPEGMENSVRYAASYFRKRNPDYKFMVRKQEDGTYRCWRIANEND